MTAGEIYDTALALLGESSRADNDDYTALVLPLLGVLLAESFEVEQSIRRAAGEAQLTAIPAPDALSETVPYHDTLTRDALPYGLCAALLDSEDEAERALSCRNRYLSLLAAAHRWTPGSVTDVYPDGAWA